MRNRSLAQSFLVLGAATAVIVTAAPAAVGGPTATTRYASPTGTPLAFCTQADPCDIVTATTGASPLQTVIIEPGTYGSSQHPITDVLGSDTQEVTYEGAPGQPMPVIFSSSFFDFSNSSLSRVEFHTTSLQEGVAGHDISHVISVDTGANGVACEALGNITDSECLSTGANGLAVLYDLGDDFGTDTITGAIRGVTALATGTGSTGLVVEADKNITFNVSATNDIIRGKDTDVEARTTTATSSATITLDHSDFFTVNKVPFIGTTAAIVSASGNISAAPKLNAAGLELAGSPTIDAGAADPATETDLTGGPRTLGPAPDMGAVEFPPFKPTARSLKVTKRHKHSLTVTVKVNPGDLATHVKLTVTHKHSHHTRTKTVAAATTPVTVSLTVHHLKRHTTYHLHVTATNSKGTAKTGTKKGKTR